MHKRDPRWTDDSVFSRVFGFILIFQFVVIGVICYVAYHFISKYW